MMIGRGLSHRRSGTHPPGMSHPPSAQQLEEQAPKRRQEQPPEQAVLREAMSLDSSKHVGYHKPVGVLWTGSLKNQNTKAWGGGVSLRRRGGEKETVCLSREKRLSENRVHHPVPHTTSGNSKQPSSS